MSSARFSQSHGILPMVKDGDYSSGFSMETINMAHWGHVTMIMYGDSSVTGGGKLTVMGGTSDEAETAAINFTYRYSTVDTEAAGADVFSTPGTSSDLTLTEAYIKQGLYVIEWDVEDMDVSNVTYQFATPVLDSSGGAGTMTAIAILSEPRYAKDVMPTAIPT